MKVLAGNTDKECILEFENLQEFESFFQETGQTGSFVIANRALRLDAVFRARVAGSPRTRIIRPKKMYMDSTSLVVQIEHAGPAHLEKKEPVEMTQLGKNPADKIRAMTVTEKSVLAMNADLSERRVLIQDTNPKIQEFILRNPRITELEIAWMAKNPTSAIPTLLTILQRKDWMNSDSIRQGILTNPKTPAHIVLDMIPRLASPDLIKMFRTYTLREDVRQSVKTEMKKRGIRVTIEQG